MLRIVGAICVLTLFTALGGSVRADDDADLRAIVTKAINAHGGADNLDKFKAATTKTKGKVSVMGMDIDFTGETSIQFPDRMRAEVDFAIQGNKFKYVSVLDGNKGWFSLADMTKEMTRDMLEAARERMYVANVSHLTPLADKAVKMSALGEMKVGDRPAVGVRVEQKEHQPVNLYFDKDKGLLLKTEAQEKDPMNGGMEFTAETLYSDYRKVAGMMVPHRVVIKRNGQPFVDAETTESKHFEKLDDSVFAKP
jgi:hypothetical protein